MQIKHFRTLVFFLFTVVPFSRAQQTWTLEKCLSYAHEHNLKIKQAGLDAVKAKEDLQMARFQRLPDINTGGRASWNNGLTQNLTTGVLENQTLFGSTLFASLSLPVFQGFLLNNQIRTSLKRLELSQYAGEQIRKQTDAEIVTAFLNILLAYEQKNAAGAQWKATRKQVEKTRELIKAGSLPAGDLKDLEAQAASDYLRFVQLEQQYKLSKIRLALLLELENPEDFEPDVSVEHFRVDESLLMKNPLLLAQNHWEDQPEGKTARTQKDIARLQIKTARSGYFPSLSFFSSWNSRFVDRNTVRGFEPDPDNPYRIIGITAISHENVLAPNFRPVLGPPDPFFTQIKNNQGLSFGFQLNIPVFNKFRTRLQVQKAKVDFEKSVLNEKIGFNQYKSTVYKLFSDAISAKENLKAAEKNYEAAQKAYRYALEKFKAGLLTSYDLENAKSRKVTAEAQKIQAKFEYLFKLKLLELQIQKY